MGVHRTAAGQCAGLRRQLRRLASTTTATTAALSTGVALVAVAVGAVTAAAARRTQAAAAIGRGRLTVLHLERGAHGRQLQLLGLAVLVAMAAHGQLVAVRVGDGTGADGYLDSGMGMGAKMAVS